MRAAHARRRPPTGQTKAGCHMRESRFCSRICIDTRIRACCLFTCLLSLVPRRGLEPPRSYPLVPETSASTNSATWASQETEILSSKKQTSQVVRTASADLLNEVEGTVQGHRDGHGFVVRDDGQPDLYLAPQEMRAVLHRDRVKARVIRVDRRGRPEARVLEILERRKTPIIGRLLNESGVWLVAPEDRRYGQDILVPKNATANATAGQVVAIELTEPPSMYSQPVGRVTEVLGEIDDPGMEIEIAVRKYEVPHRFEPETLAQAASLPDKLRAADLRHRIDLRDVAAGHDRRRGRARLRRRGLLRADHDRPLEDAECLAAGGRDCRRQPLRQAGRAARRGCLRARDLGLLPAPRDSDAAREAVERPVFAQSGRGPAGDGVRHDRRRQRRRSMPTSSFRR